MRRVAAALLALALVPACRGATPPEPSDPVPGGTLTVAVRDLATLDPARVTGQGAQSAVAQIYDSLTAVDPATGLLRPAAATGWSASEDGLRWTFSLNETATWSDGRRVTAADFKLAFDRITRRTVRSDAAFVFEHVRGFREVNVTGSAQALSGVRAMSPTRLRITLTRPFAELPYVLSHPRLGPVPAHRFRRSEDGLGRAPVTNGPFRVAEFKVGESLALQRNDRYAGATPYVERIVFRVASSVEEGWRWYGRGDVDVAEVPAAAAETARTPFGDGGFVPAWATLSFGVNMSLAKYAKPEVRRAISLAIDRDAITRTVYGGTKTSATGIIPRGVRGFRADACEACTLDRGRARGIVVAAFGNRPPTITVDHLTERSSRQVAQAVAANLREVGFRTRLRAHTLQAYRVFLAEGKQDLAQLGWIADVSSPDAFLSQQLRTGATDNHSKFSDAEFDRRIDRARSQQDDGNRLAEYRAAERRALELMPLIPVVFFEHRIAVARHVRDFRVDGAGVFDGAGVWVADA